MLENQQINIKSGEIFFLLAVFILRTRTNLGKHFIVRLVTRLNYRDGHKTHNMRPEELPCVVRHSRRISKESSCGRIMCLVPIFIHVTHNQTNYKMFAQVRTDRQCDCSIKTAIDALSVLQYKNGHSRKIRHVFLPKN